MKTCRRFLMTFFVVLYMLPVSNANAAAFPDVINYTAEINYLKEQDILNGYTDGTFKPSNHINRLNGVQVLLKAKGITNFDAPNPNFTDMTPDAYGYAEVAKAVELGIISGKKHADGSRYFDPKGQLTRGQMAKVIVEAMEYSIDGSFTFRDVPKSNGFHDYISTLAKEQITEGFIDGTFRPSLAVSRQHFAVFVARMLNDDFKPEPKPTNFLLDTSMDYTREIYSNGRASLSKLIYVGSEQGHLGVYDKWIDTTIGRDSLFVVWEDEKGLYTGYLESEYYWDLLYPLYIGKVYTDGWDRTMTVTGMGLTMKTKAGTFTHVVSVKTDDGYTYYYAPNVGHIKTEHNGNTMMQLVELTPRR